MASKSEDIPLYFRLGYWRSDGGSNLGRASCGKGWKLNRLSKSPFSVAETTGTDDGGGGGGGGGATRDLTTVWTRPGPMVGGG